METAFFYKFKARIIFKKDNNELAFEEVEKDFENENPILARENALRFFNSYVEVVTGVENISAEQLKEKEIDFIDPGTNTLIQVDSNNIYLSDSIGNGIGVFLCFKTGFIEQEENEMIIHGFGGIGPFGLSKSGLIYNLEKEFELYKKFDYGTSGYETTVLFCDPEEWAEGYREDEPSSYKILKTPINWDLYSAPYWWGKDTSDQIEEKNKTEKLINIIENGETSQVEFKPALLYNFLTKKGGIGIKAIIAKTICGFLNTKGGILFIGINDKKKIVGLEKDFSLSDGKDEKDFFRLEFDQMIDHFLSFSVKPNVNGDFQWINEKDIFVVIVEPSKAKPVFLKGQNEKEFYVRGEASTRQLTDIEEIIDYWIERMGNF
ncbi:MAG TPA: hypothetical protein DEA97_06895 [Bacteroidales bacterium]|nr:MAG: Eco57I restriction endonuclease [candidate division TM6 bacterium GW2011_GWF2_33_332]OFY78402.1 MAG: hypothetical protein A2281_11950 [Bacteroidetes bacterium RIFOXYA12_FULL_38_20]HBS86264.1 hypothetical protein [Bacteroidales bacterium]